MVDTIFADVAQPDQARIVAINASYFLKSGGHFVISIKVGWIIQEWLHDDIECIGFFPSEILVLVIFHFGCDRGRLPIKTNIPATFHI